MDGEVFIQAYERSAQRYTVIRGAVGDPDPFRVKCRQAIAEQVAEIIRARCTRREAVARLRQWAEESVIETDRKRFVAAAEETLAGIHEGNFARYRARPSESQLALKARAREWIRLHCPQSKLDIQIQGLTRMARD